MTVEVDGLEPISGVWRVATIAPVPPRIERAGVEGDLAYGESRAGEELFIHQRSDAGGVAMDEKAQVVDFKTSLPLEEDAGVESRSGERDKIDSSRGRL